MESIDRLREYVCDMTSVSSMTKANMSVYLDAIEQEVEQLRDREYQNGREDARGAVEFSDRLCRASERREDVTLWGVDYMPLPVDADGVPIHVGDVLVDWETPRPVAAVSEDSICLAGYESDSYYRMGIAKNYRHHHAPTVEDVLREFTDEVWNRCCEGATASDSGIDELVAEFAAKLTLRGEE